MAEHGNWHDPILINTIGHTAGVLLFGLITTLLVLDWRTRGLRRTKLSLVAALLALNWNVGSLIVLGSPHPASLAIGVIVTANFSMLSLLPAVLLQVAVQGRQRLIVATGYAVSVCAASLHFSELFSWGVGLHQAGLILIAVGFVPLTLLMVLFGQRRDSAFAQKSEWISPTCLLLFTTSFLHFGYQHVRSPWEAEIAWHHVGIPVALIVLLRDYRFLLLDTFIRFLVNSGLAAAYLAAVLALNQRFRLWDLIRPSMFLTGMSLVSLCLSLILFAYLRNALQAWASRVVFRRQNVEDCIKAISEFAMSARSEEELLSGAAQRVADYLRTDRVSISTEMSGEARLEKTAVLLRERDRNEATSKDFHVEAQIQLQFSSGDARRLTVGPRRGGRRYWSDDLDDMRHLGIAIVEQVERFRNEELKRLASQAELRALRAQVNPHFLFNALNTLYGTIDRGSPQARRMVLNLAEIFRYSLQGDRTVILLSEELRIVEAYLEIETLRLGDRLKTEVTVSASALATFIPILSIQPLVENAVKHGIAEKQGRGLVCVKAEDVAAGLRVTIEDTGVGFERSRNRSHGGTGLGLENVRRRLTLSYGPTADLQIHTSAAGTTVTFLIPDSARAEQAAAEVEVGT